MCGTSPNKQYAILRTKKKRAITTTVGSLGPPTVQTTQCSASERVQVGFWARGMCITSAEGLQPEPAPTPPHMQQRTRRLATQRTALQVQLQACSTCKRDPYILLQHTSRSSGSSCNGVRTSFTKTPGPNTTTRAHSACTYSSTCAEEPRLPHALGHRTARPHGCLAQSVSLGYAPSRCRQLCAATSPRT